MTFSDSQLISSNEDNAVRPGAESIDGQLQVKNHLLLIEGMKEMSQPLFKIRKQRHFQERISQ